VKTRTRRTTEGELNEEKRKSKQKQIKETEEKIEGEPNTHHIFAPGSFFLPTCGGKQT